MRHTAEKVKYPKSVFFIVSNEFCERFSYYGMRTILSIYLTDMLFFSETNAQIIYHAFTMLVYFFPLFGAMLADSFLGKFRTIFYVSIIYAIGNIILALAAAPPLHLPGVEFSMLGLLLIALGTGGIKPCVSAFGGDQFVLPQQEKELVAFFSMFYFAINFGSFISTFITPILREHECFDSTQCFSLAFGVPGALMVVSIIIFGAGKKLYKIREPEGNMVVKVSKCIGNAIRTKSKSTMKKEHWLDHAEEKYGAKLVSDVKATLRVLVLYIPLPIFWALFDQQGTGWTFQARRMDGDIGFYTILPDQMQVVNPLLILIFIPLFEYAIYPLLNKLNLLKSPLQRLVAGGCLASIAFIISACLALVIEAENPVLPQSGNGHLFLYNNLNCDVKYSSSELENEVTIPAMEYKKIEKDFKLSIDLPFDITTCNGNKFTKVLTMDEKKAVGYYFTSPTEVNHFYESAEKDGKGLPRIRTLVNGGSRSSNLTYLNKDGEKVYTATLDNTTQISLAKPSEFTLEIDDSFKSESFTLKLGGVYTILVDATDSNNINVKSNEITPHNGVHMFWIIPQYVVITMGEIMFSITGLEFSYSQAPASMKSVLQACWLLTSAFGNLIVVIISSADIFEKQSYNFFMYAALMLIDMVVFSLMAMRYTYVEKDQDDSINLEATENMNGIDNMAFGDKEKSP